MSDGTRRSVSAHYCYEDCPCALAEVERLRPRVSDLEQEVGNQSSLRHAAETRSAALLAVFDEMRAALESIHPPPTSKFGVILARARKVAP